MNVTCPNCATMYRVDPAKVPEQGVRARCAVCSAIFPVSREAAPASGGDAPRFPAAVPTAGPSGDALEPVLSAPAPPPVAREPRVEPAAMQAPPAPTAAQPPAAAAPERPAPPPEPPRPAPRPEPPVEPPRPAAAAPRPPIATPGRAEGFSAAPARPMAPPPAMPRPAGVPPRPAAPPAAPRGPAPEPRRAVNPFLSQDPSQKARRLARALISDMVVYHPAKRREGLRDGSLKTLFDEEIKKSWEEYVDQVGKEIADSTTHFHDALNEILADGRQIF